MFWAGLWMLGLISRMLVHVSGTKKSRIWTDTAMLLNSLQILLYHMLYILSNKWVLTTFCPIKFYILSQQVFSVCLSVTKLYFRCTYWETRHYTHTKSRLVSLIYLWKHVRIQIVDYQNLPLNLFHANLFFLTTTCRQWNHHRWPRWRWARSRIFLFKCDWRCLRMG